MKPIALIPFATPCHHEPLDLVSAKRKGDSLVRFQVFRGFDPVVRYPLFWFRCLGPDAVLPALISHLRRWSCPDSTATVEGQEVDIPK
eukprot:COSAG02_NODE_21618_length_781_cov_0.978006_2_plen_87_part_01